MIIFQTKKVFNKNNVIENSWDNFQAQNFDELASLDSKEVAEAKKRWENRK